MDKTLEYIKGFYDKGYQTSDMQNSRDLKKFVIHLLFIQYFKQKSDWKYTIM
jgi:hypothetical protein